MQGQPNATPTPRRGIRRFAALTTYFSSIGVALLGLVNVLLVSRELGPSGRGQVAFLTTVATISGYLANLSVHEANANFARRGRRMRASLGTNSVLLALASSSVAAAAAAGALAFLPFLSKGVSTGHLLIALAAIPAATLQTYLVYLARGAYYFTAANLALLASPIVSILINVAMLGVHMLSVTSALTAWTAGNFASAFVIVYHHHTRTGFGSRNRALASHAVRFGAQSHIGGIFATGSYSMDQWILGAAAGPRELGLYSVAVSWFQGLFILPMAVAVVARPDMIRLDREDAGPYIARTFRLTIVATTFLAAALFVLAPFLCGRVFGGAFRDAATPLRVLAPGALGICTVKMLGTALIAQGKPLLESSAMATGFVAAIVLYLVLIPMYGGVGAALASTIAYTVAGLAAAVLLSRNLNLGPTDLIPRLSDVRRLFRAVASRRLR